MKENSCTLFTSAAILEMLTQIKELDPYDIEVVEVDENRLHINVGDSSYFVDSSIAETIDVSEDVIETVEEVTDETFQDVNEELGNSEFEAVEGGLIKDMIHTMLLGGAVKFISNSLKK